MCLSHAGSGAHTAKAVSSPLIPECTLTTHNGSRAAARLCVIRVSGSEKARVPSYSSDGRYSFACTPEPKPRGLTRASRQRRIQRQEKNHTAEYRGALFVLPK